MNSKNTSWNLVHAVARGLAIILLYIVDLWGHLLCIGYIFSIVLRIRDIQFGISYNRIGYNFKKEVPSFFQGCSIVYYTQIKCNVKLNNEIRVILDMLDNYKDYNRKL